MPLIRNVPSYPPPQPLPSPKFMPYVKFGKLDAATTVQNPRSPHPQPDLPGQRCRRRGSRQWGKCSPRGRPRGGGWWRVEVLAGVGGGEDGKAPWPGVDLDAGGGDAAVHGVRAAQTGHPSPKAPPPPPQRSKGREEGRLCWLTWKATEKGGPLHLRRRSSSPPKCNICSYTSKRIKCEDVVKDA